MISTAPPADRAGAVPMVVAGQFAGACQRDSTFGDQQEQTKKPIARPPTSTLPEEKMLGALEPRIRRHQECCARLVTPPRCPKAALDVGGRCPVEGVDCALVEVVRTRKAAVTGTPLDRAAGPCTSR